MPFVVFKPDSSTTPVRPVFDASSKFGKAPSVNELLEKGSNLLELLPTIILQFREDRIGIVADIRKAFQIIEVTEKDRDYLRFLWWEDPIKRTVKIYRHRRVVFGLNFNPFLLAAVLELHLRSVKGSQKEVAQKLWRSFCVDSCATSASSYEEYERFRQLATNSMSEAGMNLRNW